MDAAQTTTQSIPKPLVTPFRVVFGIILPLVCLALDPGMFQRSSVWGYGPFEAYRIACWFCVVVECLALSLAFLGVVRKKPAIAVLSGVLLVGAAFSAAVGIVMLPATILGLFILIGALGLTPFFSAIVYFRVGRDLQRRTAAELRPAPRRLLAATGVLFVLIPALAIQAWVQWETDRIIALLRSPDADTVEHAMADIERERFFLSAARVYEATLAEHDELVRARLQRGAERLGAVFGSD